MAAYVHADAENTKKERIRFFSNSRMIGTKVRSLFSGEVLMFACMILVVASFMITDSYYKAYKTNLESRIVKMLNETKEMEWQKSTSEHRWLQMTSSSELMKKAVEMKLSVTTSDKFVRFD